MEESYKYCKDISSKRYTNIVAELTLWKLEVPNKTPSQNKWKRMTSNTNLPKSEESTITLEEIQRLHTLFSYQNSTVDYNEVDPILAKIGLNVTNLSNIKDMLKSSYEGMGALVFESFFRKLILDCKKSVEPFIKECVRICWLMVNMDQPIYIKFSKKRGSKFDRNLFRCFSRSGQKVDYNVWPALFLHKNGPLICKGVVEPMAD